MWSIYQYGRRVFRRYCCLLLALAALVSGCAGEEEVELTSYDVQFIDYFDTVTSITIYAASQEEFAAYREIAQESLAYYHQLYDIYDTYPGVNNIKSINDSAGRTPVEVDEAVIDLLDFAAEMYADTGGRVNVAMGSVLSIWHDYREEALREGGHVLVPDMVELEKAAAHTDIEDVIIDRAASTVYLADPDLRLDVGAVAKGYAAQRLADELRAAGVTSGLLSLGGNVAAIGRKGNGNNWRVGVQNPDLTAAAGYVHVVGLDDRCLVTSGTYQRFYEKDGVRYHHIINPDTLMPENEFFSVTILCDDSGRADAYSTAIFNMPLEEGLAFVEARQGLEAFWILADCSEEASSGFADWLDE